MRKMQLLAPLFGLSLLTMALACGDDDDDDSGSDESALTGDCLEISEVCHEIDDGTGEASECHEIAHDNVAAACAEHKEQCGEICGTAGDGGVHRH